eukprot:1433620-Ditylum_brightwellii.AAC.1
MQINKLEEVKRHKTYLMICKEKQHHQSITFEGNEIHNKTTIELAIEELKKFIPQVTYELYHCYTKKLCETKANATVIAYLQQANIQSATAVTQQALEEEKPVSSQ